MSCEHLAEPINKLMVTLYVQQLVVDKTWFYIVANYQIYKHNIVWLVETKIVGFDEAAWRPRTKPRCKGMLPLQISILS